MYWLANFGIWAVIEPHPPIREKPRHRFSNLFGVGSPAEQQLLQITVEINPPHEGENQRVAGLFAQDQDHHLYLAHSGRVGGGRPGIGLKEFRKFLGNTPWQETETEGGKRAALIFGPRMHLIFTLSWLHLS